MTQQRGKGHRFLLADSEIKIARLEEEIARLRQDIAKAGKGS